MSEWIINEEAWQPRSKPPSSSCALYLLCCLSNIRTGLPQTKTRQKRVTRQVLPPGEREAESVGCKHCYVCVWGEKKKDEIPERQKQTSWNSRMEGTIIMQVIIHEITDLEWERKSTGGKEPCSESHPCNYSIRTKRNRGRTHTHTHTSYRTIHLFSPSTYL